MHIKSVTAAAFGPLVEETLHLSSGLTVIHGDNESAKSSWHAAIYAALCGRRRGRGATQTADREFAERRRPWDGDSWRVSCEIRLDDGRTVTLRHDLDGKVDCSAHDERGLDLSGEIMYDGAPDGSRWLGLNRRTFAATACVNQAELLRVMEAADDLQTDIERAAATAGKDETAAAALGALKKYASDHVGLERANSRKPLRRARGEHQHAHAALEAARQAHQDYLRLVAEADAAQESATAASAQRSAREDAFDAAAQLLHAVEALTAAQAGSAQAAALASAKRAKAEASRDRSAKAAELSQSVASQQPASVASDDALAQQVAAAIGRWQSAPSPPRLSGLSAAEIRAQLDSLPLAPTGAVAVDPTVEQLRDAYVQAVAVLQRDERNRVGPREVSPGLATAATVGPASLRSLAERLDNPLTDVDPDCQRALDAALEQREHAAAALSAAELGESAALDALRFDGGERRLTFPAPASAGNSRWRSARILGAGAALFVLGALLVVGGHVGAGLAALAVGAGVAVGELLRRGRHAGGGSGGGSNADTAQELTRARDAVRRARDLSFLADRAYLEAEARVDGARRSHAVTTARRHAAVREAADLGLPADAAQLNRLADEAEVLLREQAAADRWRHEHAADEDARRSSAQRLADALSDRGFAVLNDAAGAPDVLEVFAAYERDCHARAEQARSAQRRDDLRRQLGDRLEAERAAAQAQQARRAAWMEVTRAAASTEVAGAVGLGEQASATDRRGVQAEAAPADAAAEDIIGELQNWLRRRASALTTVEQQRSRWQQLQTLLDGCTLSQLAAAAAADAQAAAAAARQAADGLAGLAAKELAAQAAAVRADAPYPIVDQACRDLLTARRQQLQQARQLEAQLSQAASGHRGKVDERELTVPSVPEAEEALDRAQRELDRVQSLDRVLGLTTSFLERAQDKTYTDLAPVLSEALSTWLPEITAGRYRRARVDPETLAVRVETASGALRRADRLSVGTAEQIYLLLRVALAEHLATKSTVSPLLLDDVTVQADPARTEAILRMCLALADRGRQVVLFAQEPFVASWAECNLDGTRDTLIRLSVPVAA